MNRLQHGFHFDKTQHKVPVCQHLKVTKIEPGGKMFAIGADNYNAGTIRGCCFNRFQQATCHFSGKCVGFFWPRQGNRANAVSLFDPNGTGHRFMLHRKESVCLECAEA